MALASCAGGASAGIGLVVILSLSVLSLAGCRDPLTIEISDGGRKDDGDGGPGPETGRGEGQPQPPDGGRDGTWETCCVNGRLSTCFCPAKAACNYGLGLVTCPDGTCSWGGAGMCRLDGGVDARDADLPDRGGFEAGADRFVPEVGRDVPEDGGGWGRCCLGGRTDTCYCPPKTACNFGSGVTHCTDGTCFFSFGQPDGGMCRADGGRDAAAVY